MSEQLAFDENRGSLTYYFNEESKAWTIEEIFIRDDLQRTGLGSSLLQSFVQRVGHQQPVHAVITHDATIQSLKDSYFSLAASKGFVTVSQEDMDTLPITHVFSRGNIDIQTCTIQYNPLETNEVYEDAYEVHITGVTQ